MTNLLKALAIVALTPTVILLNCCLLTWNFGAGFMLPIELILGVK